MGRRLYRMAEYCARNATVPILFFSRRIGLSNGQSVPVIAGGRVTGKAGKFDVGGLALTTLPVALALIWAIDTGSTVLVTIYGVLTVAVGWVVLQVGIRIATRRLRGHEPEFVLSVTPSR